MHINSHNLTPSTDRTLSHLKFATETFHRQEKSLKITHIHIIHLNFEIIKSAESMKRLRFVEKVSKLLYSADDFYESMK